MKKLRSEPELLPLTGQTLPVIELGEATENIQDENFSTRWKERKVLGGRKGRGPPLMSVLDISAHFKILEKAHSNGDPVVPKFTTPKRKRKFDDQNLMTGSPAKRQNNLRQFLGNKEGSSNTKSSSDNTISVENAGAKTDQSVKVKVKVPDLD